MGDEEPVIESLARVWIARLDRLPPEACQDWLDESERLRLLRFACPIERRRRRAAWSLRRHALSQIRPDIPPAAWRFALDGAGKPELASPFAGLGLSHNLSHSGSYVAVMVALGPCGVDVEAPPQELEALSEVLTPAEEHDVCASARPADRFLQYWTVKEAVLKLLGTGFLTPPRALELTIADDERSAEVRQTKASSTIPPAGLQLSLWTLPDGYRLAAACIVAESAPRPVLSEWSAAA